MNNVFVVVVEYPESRTYPATRVFESYDLAYQCMLLTYEACVADYKKQGVGIDDEATCIQEWQADIDTGSELVNIRIRESNVRTVAELVDEGDEQ